METIRGTVSEVQFVAAEGHATRYADNLTSASPLKFKVGGRSMVVVRDEVFPPLNPGDEVEVSGMVNADNGLLEVRSLHNHTTGTIWKVR